MKPYADMSPDEIVRTMGGVQKTLLRRLARGPVAWEQQHPSTRDALITRGLAVRCGVVLQPTGRGEELAARLWAAGSAEAREAILPAWSGDVPLFGETS